MCVLCICVCCVYVCVLSLSVCVCVWEGRSPHYLAGNLLLNASFVGSKWGTIKQVEGVTRWRGIVGNGECVVGVGRRTRWGKLRVIRRVWR